MTSLRALRRALLLPAWTLPVYLLLQVGRLALLAAPRRAARWRSAMIRLWARGVCRILGVTVEVEGAPPAEPYLLVCNHLSYVDIFVMKAATGACLVSKAEVARWPLFGFLARTSGTIFVERGRRTQLPHVLARMTDRWRRGHGVLFFPEGTSMKGCAVEAFKPSLFEAAQMLGQPVHAAAIEYHTPPGDAPAWQTVCWWGGVPMGAHLRRLLGLKSFAARVRFSPEAITGADRQEQALRAHAAVDRLFEPLLSEAEAESWRRTPGALV